MLSRYKTLFLEGLKKTYNVKVIKLVLGNYGLISPKWLTTKNLPLYLTALFLFVYWLYYQIFCVSPVCPFYTGPDFPSLLNKFKSVGKVYRPTIYLSNAKIQWVFLKLYCYLEFFNKISKYRILKRPSSVKSVFYKVGLVFNRLILKTFFFRKIFKSQPTISLRELVEGHNGSLVVLDWYLPKWLSPQCKTCGMFKHEENFYTSNNSPNPYSSPKDLEVERENNVEHSTKKQKDNFRMYTIDSLNHLERVRETESELEEVFDPSTSEVSSSAQGETVDVNQALINDKVYLSHLLNQQLERIKDTVPPRKFSENEDFLNYRRKDSPNPRIIRGVLAIIGDMNVSYRICSTKAGCYCNAKEFEKDEKTCDTCNRNDQKDYDGINLEHPGFPVLRSLINDALRLGFVCVQLHLNINMGMASEAFPDTTTLRAFPISLYSDVLLDLDCALNKVSDRFPNSSLVAVGISYGSNILMEYLALSSKGGTFKAQSDSDIENYNDYIVSTEIPKTAAQELYEESPKGSHESKKSKPEVKEFKTLDQMSEYTNSSRLSETTEKKHNILTALKARSLRSEIKNEVNESFVEEFNNNQSSSRFLPSSRFTPELLYEDHFTLDLNREEYNTETKLVYPDQKQQITLNPERISAAVCINPNLRLSGNLLYNISKRRYRKFGMYRKYCYTKFKENLCDLLALTHCKRTNANVQKDCINFNCCHHKMVNKIGILKKISYRIFTIKNKIKPIHKYSVEKIITQLHRQYRQSYRDLKSQNREFINYGSFMFEKLGIRTCSDFKLGILMTLRNRFEREGQDGKVKIKQITEEPVYRFINKKVNTNLRIGKSVFVRSRDKMGLNLRRMVDYKVAKYINGLINSDYTRNVTSIKENIHYINVPTLLLYSLDNSVFTLRDVDIFEVIRNPNIVYYISKTGGYSTFLSGKGRKQSINSGIRPLTWFIGPVLEFLEEMSTKIGELNEKNKKKQEIIKRKNERRRLKGKH